MAAQEIHDPPAATQALLRVGELLLGAGFATGEAIESGLARQRRENRKLGELIVDLGMLDKVDLDAVLLIQNDLRAGHTGELADVVGSRLGAILLASNCVSKFQLDRALDELDDSDEHLGEILLRAGVLSRAQLQGALVFQARVHARRSDRFKLGRMLLESGDITETALSAAIARQKANGRRLGEVLLEQGAISRPALGAGLSRQRRLIAAAMAAIAIIGNGGMSNSASAAGTRLQVSARVLSHVSFRSMKVPGEVVITSEDIARGYVDLAQPIEVEVQTNNAGGVMVGVSLNSPHFEGAMVSGSFGRKRITPGMPTLLLATHGQGMRTEALSLRMRIELSRDTVPGVVVMPVTLLVSPI